MWFSYLFSVIKYISTWFEHGNEFSDAGESFVQHIKIVSTAWYSKYGAGGYGTGGNPSKLCLWPTMHLTPPENWSTCLVNCVHKKLQAFSPKVTVVLFQAMSMFVWTNIIWTSNVPAPSGGNVVHRCTTACACQHRRWWPREKPLHNGLGVMPGQYASNAEGDDDGKNHRCAENHVFR